LPYEVALQQKENRVKLSKLAQAISVICIAGPALAQTPPPDNKPVVPQKIEKIQVTGSSIKRVEQDSALPIQVITREEITREGISSTEQLIMLLSTNGTGLDNLASNADVVSGQARGNNGASSANLRGQGSAATLILLNGRRVAAHGLNGGAVDINQIPLAAVERVEVLKDGASAIYGTDAIGGVINFILRKNYTGLTVQAFVDKTQDSGGDIYRGSIVGGYGDIAKDGFNVMATLTFSDNKELRGDQRDFVNTFQPNRGLSVDTRGTPFATILPLGVGPNTPGGTLLASAGTSPFLPGSTTVRASGGINALNLPGGLGCGVVDGQAAYDSRLWDFAEARFACAWDTGRAAVIQQPVKNTNFVSRGVMQFGEHQVSAEITGSKVEAAKRFSNLQLTPNTTTQNYAYFRNAASASTYDRVFNQLVAVFPTLETRRGLPFGYRWRCIECGRREIETTTDTGRFFLGADGPLFGSWDYRVGASQAFSESDSKLGSGYYYRNTTRDANGNVIANGIIDALNTGVINPFLLPGETQSQAALDLLAGASAKGVVLYGGKFTLTQIDGSTSGPVFKLPGGDAMAAVGLDFRTEKYNFNGDARAAAARPVIIAAPFDDANALSGVKRDIKAVYAEILLPVTKSFEATVAVRRDDYTGFGATTNPKVSMKFKPVEQVMFRGSYNTGFRVPTFNQIFNGVQLSLYAGRDLADPGKCPGGKPDSNRPGCEVIQPDIANGGKSDLGPEKAKQATVGIVIEPMPNMSMTLDWWRINRTDTIQILSLQQLVDNVGIFGDRFFRDSTGVLRVIDQRWINAGESVTQGLELGLRGNGQLLSGKWSAGLDGTYLIEKKSRVVASVPYGPSEIGQFTFGGDLGLRWKHNAFFTYKEGSWSASLSQIFRKGYKNQELPGVTSGIVSPPDLQKNVDNYITYNLSASYSGIKNLTITGGVKNLFNTDPPFAITYDSSTGSGSSWEPRVADPRGRSFTLLIDYKFF
jgi:iron complex outermembrane recepter protein